MSIEEGETRNEDARGMKPANRLDSAQRQEMPKAGEELGRFKAVSPHGWPVERHKCPCTPLTTINSRWNHFHIAQEPKI